MRCAAASSFSIDISITEIRPYLVVYGTGPGIPAAGASFHSPSPLCIGCFPPSIVITFPRAQRAAARHFLHCPLPSPFVLWLIVVVTSPTLTGVTGKIKLDYEMKWEYAFHASVLGHNV